MKTLLDLSPEQLRKAAQIKDQIVTLERQLQALLGQEGAVSQTRQEKGMSAARRAEISAAMKARWARVRAGKSAKKESAVAVAKPAGRRRRKMTPAQRALIAEKMKAHWAKVRAAKA